jgi:hypothetical protein
VIPADQALKARPDPRTAVVRAELECLVHTSIPISEVCALWVSQVETEALGCKTERVPVAWWSMGRGPDGCREHARVVRKARVGEDRGRGEAGDNHLQVLKSLMAAADH